VSGATSPLAWPVDNTPGAAVRLAITAREAGHMNTNTIKLAACLAWAAAVVSSATPATALATTTQIGSYANCSASTTTLAQPAYKCVSVDMPGGWPFYYMQTIRLTGTTCNAGGCDPTTSSVYTDTIYPVGRKVASLDSLCSSSWRLYGLDTCAC
jgi:hypothetical protein